MPKKDVESAILGMLSTAGSETRPLRPAPAEDEAPADTVTAPPREDVDREPLEAPSAVEPAAESETLDVPESTAEQEQPAPTDPPRSIARSTRSSRVTSEAPRTLRLRPTSAAALREAWLEAKRDDVLLTAQDFASDLLEEMLRIRRRRTKAAS